MDIELLVDAVHDLARGISRPARVLRNTEGSLFGSVLREAIHDVLHARSVARKDGSPAKFSADQGKRFVSEFKRRMVALAQSPVPFSSADLRADLKTVLKGLAPVFKEFTGSDIDDMFLKRL